MHFSDRTGFYTSLSDYPLIAYRGEVPVVVMLSKEDEKRFHKFYSEVFLEKDIGKRQEAFLSHRKWFYSRMLKILEGRLIKNLPPEWEDTKLRWIPFGQLEDYYDNFTGFRWREEDLKNEVWIL